MQSDEDLMLCNFSQLRFLSNGTEGENVAIIFRSITSVIAFTSSNEVMTNKICQ